MCGNAPRSTVVFNVKTAILFCKLARLKKGLTLTLTTGNSINLNGSLLFLASHSPNRTFNPVVVLFYLNFKLMVIGRLVSYQ